MSQISMASVKPEEGKFVAPHAPRPVWGDKIRKELAEIVGGEIRMWDGGLVDSLERCIGYIYKLLERHPNEDGYRLARALECDEGFTPDTELVDILDGVQYKKYELIGKAVKEWVKKYALTLDFEVGQKVLATVNRRGKVETSEFEVVKLYPETMQYGLWNESLGYSEREGCLLVEFERVTALTTHIGDSHEVDKHKS